MSIRPLRLPADFPVGIELFKQAFQYPGHPEWEATLEEQQNFTERIGNLARWWPLMRVLIAFSPQALDSLRGFVWEEDGAPVGGVTCQCVGAGRWEIGMLGVLPAYRGRGIARQLLQTALGYIRQRGGKTATLLTIDGNLPANTLYERAGFVEYTTRLCFTYPAASPAPSLGSLPEGYRLEAFRFLDYRPIYDLDRRITPAAVTQYQPVERSSYQMPLPQRLFIYGVNRLGGVSTRDVLIYAGKELIARGSYEARLRPGGVNSLSLRSDPSHPEIAGYLLAYLLNAALAAAPGRDVEFTLAAWQEREIEAAQALGCQPVEPRYLRLGLAL